MTRRLFNPFLLLLARLTDPELARAVQFLKVENWPIRASGRARRVSEFVMMEGEGERRAAVAGVGCAADAGNVGHMGRQCEGILR